VDDHFPILLVRDWAHVQFRTQLPIEEVRHIAHASCDSGSALLFQKQCGKPSNTINCDWFPARTNARLNELVALSNMSRSLAMTSGGTRRARHAIPRL